MISTTIHTINTGLFKLDGGAMHGVVPKSMWQKQNPADDNNMCTWAMRCLLVNDGKQLTLIDTGIGNKQDSKFLGHYFLHGEDTLAKSIMAAGYSPDDITQVFLTHLHFDHVGGAVTKNSNGMLVPTFKNATYISNAAHLNWAQVPNAREKASFLTENFMPLEASGQLLLLDAKPQSSYANLDGWEIIFVDGHTEKMMLPVIPYKGRKLIFAADLFPSVAHLSLPWVMAYDMRPLKTLDEKDFALRHILANNWVIVFEHDSVTECATLIQTEKGIKVGETFPLSAL